ncbi:MAG: Rrf2 family transcriptional regulator [Clostridiales bacterium]|jgi:Rrf2 family protein|nr:Rrf2 family transcriptional regulator [Clostridiales bacterium]
MKISTRGRYGLRAVIDLASHDGECVSAGSIASRQGIPEHYLEHLLARMNKAGFVKSVRGLYGGYRLNRPAEQITVGEVLRALEGSMYPVECLSDTDAGSCGSGGCAGCVTKPVWEKLYDSINEVLESYTLSDLAGEPVSNKT